MKPPSLSNGSWAAITLIFLVTGGSCSKMNPVAPDPTLSPTTESATAAAKNGHARCKPGGQLATSGEFDFTVDSTNQFIIAFLGQGGFGFMNYAELVYAPDHVFGMASACNFNEYIYHFKYHISTEIRDLQGRLIFSIDDNKWQVFRNAAGKFNYDDNGFEVYDKEGRIAFNFNFVNGYSQSSYFQAIIPCTDTTLGYFPHDYVFTNLRYGTRELNRVFDSIYDARPIKPLFRYTGKDWQHSRL